MALTSPALTLAVEAMFGNIKPTLNALKKLGVTDFSALQPAVEIKPGMTIKVPVSSVSAASEYNASTNHYRTGGDTDWATLTATHYLQGFDMRGTDLDQGINASRVKQLFSNRCGTGIAMAAKKAIRDAPDNNTGIPVSSSVTLPAVASAKIEHYDGLSSAKDWFDAANSVLVVNGAEYSHLKAVMHENHLSATPESIAAELGFASVLVLSGLTARALIVPYSSVGFVARVPQLIADYKEAGTETDEDSGLSLGIVVASDQGRNRQVVNGDLWFGVATVGSPANASKPGIIKVGTGA